jgi:hypothetical protein
VEPVSRRRSGLRCYCAAEHGRSGKPGIGQEFTAIAKRFRHGVFLQERLVGCLDR